MTTWARRNLAVPPAKVADPARAEGLSWRPFFAKAACWASCRIHATLSSQGPYEASSTVIPALPVQKPRLRRPITCPRWGQDFAWLQSVSSTHAPQA